MILVPILTGERLPVNFSQSLLDYSITSIITFNDVVIIININMNINLNDIVKNDVGNILFYDNFI